MKDYDKAVEACSDLILFNDMPGNLGIEDAPIVSWQLCNFHIPYYGFAAIKITCSVKKVAFDHPDKSLHLPVSSTSTIIVI